MNKANAENNKRVIFYCIISFSLAVLIIFAITFIFDLENRKQTNIYLLNQIKLEEAKTNSLSLEINDFQSFINMIQNESNKLKKKEEDLKRSNISMIYEDTLKEFKMKNNEKEIIKKRHSELVELNKNIINQLTNVQLKELQIQNSLKQLEEKNLNKSSDTYSQILNKDDIKILSDWISFPEQINLVLRYAGEGSQLDSSDFHLRCNNLKNSLIIIKTTEDNQKIGGYTNANWNGNGFKYDSKAFLFNLSHKTMYNIHISMEAIQCEPLNLPHFGNEDLVVLNKKGYSKFPSNYGLDHGSLELTQGIKKFSIDYMEVYEVMNSIFDLKEPRN